jgi:hypothetical protein
MRHLTEARLRELLADPRCPVGAQLRPHQKTRLIGLPDLLAFAEREIGAYAELEDQLDRMMTELSTERLRWVDPWSVPKRGWRRVRGMNNPRKVGYEAPADLFHSSW